MSFEEGAVVGNGLIITWKYGPCQAVYRCSFCGREEQAEYKKLCAGILEKQILLLGWQTVGESWRCKSCVNSTKRTELDVT